MVALVKKRAKVNIATYSEKMTPLHIACQRNWRSIAKFLIEHGADVHALNVIERTPLHFAAEVGRCEIAVLLLKAGARLDALDLLGWSPRQIAEFNEHREFQELMVQAGMKEKQPVIKELPLAPYHGTMWDSLVEMNRTRKGEAERDRLKWERLGDETKVAQQLIKAQNQRLGWDVAPLISLNTGSAHTKITSFAGAVTSRTKYAVAAERNM